MLRSYCLDLWELFFEEQKTKVCDVLNISECVLSSENYNMLAIKNTQTGKDYSKTDLCIWYLL